MVSTGLNAVTQTRILLSVWILCVASTKVNAREPISASRNNSSNRITTVQARTKTTTIRKSPTKTVAQKKPKSVAASPATKISSTVHRPMVTTNPSRTSIRSSRHTNPPTATTRPVVVVVNPTRSSSIESHSVATPTQSYSTGIIQSRPVPTIREGSNKVNTSRKGEAGLPDTIKLMIGAGGIYASFLYYGSLQEDVFRYTSSNGTQFRQAWFLQVLEALANVIVGFIGMTVFGATKDIPLNMLGISGVAQVSAKACTSLALANGLSFPVAILAKSGKMAPVMAGSLLLGGASYTPREYLRVVAIIGGTVIVSLGKRSAGESNSRLGVFFICLSLALDGVTAGFQRRFKVEATKADVKPQPFDYMFWSNFFMCITATFVSLGLGELQPGVTFCKDNPEIMSIISKFAMCSAVGQSFIFYTIANFDPLVLSTVTTSRKIFSVLLSILLKGHSLSWTGWSGILLACGGIASELGFDGKTEKKKDLSKDRTTSRTTSRPSPRPLPRNRYQSKL